MTIELINTGSELLLGRILNTHQQWICRQLSDLGYTVNRQVAVSDDALDIERAVAEGLARADLVITTGGLGPTCDDRTRDRISSLLGRSLRHDPVVESQIRNYFATRGRPVPRRSLIEAMVPSGAEVLPNACGTAPGLLLEIDPNSFRNGGHSSKLILLPGPPRELRPMFIEQVVPRIKRIFPSSEEFVCRTLKTAGLGESIMEELISQPLEHLTRNGLDLGFCARIGEVDVRFVARGNDAKVRVAEAETITRKWVGDYIFGEEDDVLESVIVRALSQRRKTLALAESCTGGFLADRITNVPGASAVFLGSYVTYANEAKIQALGVRAETLERHGAVSEPIAREMAEGARQNLRADFGIGITGIAGPAGGTEAKPVGTVFIALAEVSGTKILRQLNCFDRETFKYVTTQQALSLLLRSFREL